MKIMIVCAGYKLLGTLFETLYFKVEFVFSIYWCSCTGWRRELLTQVGLIRMRYIVSVFTNPVKYITRIRTESSSGMSSVGSPPPRVMCLLCVTWGRSLGRDDSRNPRDCRKCSIPLPTASFQTEVFSHPHVSVCVRQPRSLVLCFRVFFNREVNISLKPCR